MLTYKYSTSVALDSFDTKWFVFWSPHAVWWVYAITEGKKVYEAFDSETLHILGGAMDEAWRRVKLNH